MIVNRLTPLCVLLSLLATGLVPVRAQVAAEPVTQSLDGVRKAAESAVRGVIDAAPGSVKLDIRTVLFLVPPKSITAL